MKPLSEFITESEKDFKEKFPPPMLLGQNQERIITWHKSQMKALIKKVGEMCDGLKKDKSFYKVYREDYNEALATVKANLKK